MQDSVVGAVDKLDLAEAKLPRRHSPEKPGENKNSAVWFFSQDEMAGGMCVQVNRRWSRVLAPASQTVVDIDAVIAGSRQQRLSGPTEFDATDGTGALAEHLCDLQARVLRNVRRSHFQP